MTSCSCVLPRVDPSFHFPTKNLRSCSPPAATAAAFRSQSKQMDGVVLPRNKSQTLGVWANANASRGKRFSSNDVIMVDPLEAKRLAAKQMQEIQTKQKLKYPRAKRGESGPCILESLTYLSYRSKRESINRKRQRQIEAINGAWAMIGLTAGLVIEGQTGHSMLGQLAGYWSAIVSFFSR